MISLRSGDELVVTCGEPLTASTLSCIVRRMNGATICVQLAAGDNVVCTGQDATGIMVFNSDTTAVSVRVSLRRAEVLYGMAQQTLDPNATLEWTDGNGWDVLESP